MNYPDDWRKVVLDIDGLGEAGEFDLATKKCTITSGVNIMVLTSQAGLINVKQDYVVGVKASGVQNTWVYDSDVTKDQMKAMRLKLGSEDDDGNIIGPDGTTTYTDGTVLYPDGT